MLQVKGRKGQEIYMLTPSSIKNAVYQYILYDSCLNVYMFTAPMTLNGGNRVGLRLGKGVMEVEVKLSVFPFISTI